MNRLRILLADDHTITREGTRRLLAAAPDFEIVGEASDGDETARLARELRPDVLLLDIAMPGRSGLDVAAEVRRTLPATRIVVLTGYGSQTQYSRALGSLGVHGYLSKTVSAHDLVQAIRAVGRGATLGRTGIGEQGGARAGRNQERGFDATPTPREMDVLRLVAEGLRNQDIAERLCTSERTVHFHLSNLFGKLHASSRTELVYLARQEGWII